MTKSPKQKLQTPLLLPAPTSLYSRLFPQYTRLFAASPFFNRIRRVTGVMLWILLACTIGINMVAAQRDGRLSVSLPFFADKPSVLGESASTLMPNLAERSMLERQYAYWTEVLHDNPDYRDAHYQAALIAYQLGDKEKLQAHVEQMRNIDPNFGGIGQLEALSDSL